MSRAAVYGASALRNDRRDSVDAARYDRFTIGEAGQKGTDMDAKTQAFLGQHDAHIIDVIRRCG